MNALPRARQASLVVKDVDDETLVYDLETDKAHCLNSTAARVWKSCDGQTNVDQIAAQLSSENQTTVDTNLVWIALSQLEEFKLLQEPLTKPAHVVGVSRRQAVRTLGLAAALAVPMVTSIIVPTASQAQSGGQLGDCCENPHPPCLPAYECSADNPTPGCQKSCQEHQS